MRRFGGRDREDRGGGGRFGGRRDDYGDGGDRGYGRLGGGGGHGGDRGGGSHGGGSGGMSGGFEKPVKEGQEYDVTIEAVGAKGDGVCKVNNFVVFVPGVQAGQKLHIRVTKVFNRFAVGEDTGSAPGAAAAPADEAPPQSGSEAPAEESEKGSEEESEEGESEVEEGTG